jgi:TPR repeat protein
MSEFSPFRSAAAGRHAAAGGSPAEMNRLGVLLRVHGHRDEAAEWFRDGADAGNVDAMANLAIYLMAQGQNAEAAAWFRRIGGELGESLAERLSRTAQLDNNDRAAAIEPNQDRHIHTRNC